ncbi:MAG TPA: carbohydrate binding family 9 domain-containing protein, partial [Ignavibacteria bacterium]|nr:carbohydrate binding family 9 domain-containing protein [Ignavibacteria bacterium]
MIYRIITALLFIVLNYNLFSFHFFNDKDTISSGSNKPVRVYNTIRLTTEKPVIDGNLNEECWQTGEWAGDFTQWIPNEGAKPSLPTEIKILYDDNSIYVAIRAFDNEPDKISRKAGRRDQFNGDAVGINFDSYHDHRTGFEFNVTVAGQKIDLVLTNPMNADYSWNAVWYVKTGMEDSAWTAEYE